MRRHGRPRRIIIGLAAFLGTGAARSSGASLEEGVKAACLLNFAHFVEWPKESLAEASPFVIGVLGKSSSFYDTLSRTVTGESVGDHPVVVRNFQNLSEAGSCQILYVPADEEGRFAASLLKRAAVLTVDETDAFLKQGGVVRFGLQHGRIKIKINLEAAEAASLVISSKLLRLCEIVRFRSRE